MNEDRLLQHQHIAALRLVQLRDAASGAPLTPEALEIETKSGRFWHLEPSTSEDLVRLGVGPAHRMSGHETAVRHWQDLTEALPGAFDGRPLVMALEAAEPRGPELARLWTLVLSTGYRIRCARRCGSLQVSGAHAPSPPGTEG